MKKFSYIELLRLFTSLSVVIFHYIHFFYPYNSFYNPELKLDSSQLPFFFILELIYNYGRYGVQMFWAISGFVFAYVYLGQLKLIPADPDKNIEYKELMTWADEIRKLKIRTNAESPEDAKQAIKFGAEGIGLCRTEHMFFDETRILAMRKMILSDNDEDRRKAVMGLLPFQKEDFKATLRAMEGKPVTIRLLDPPLHEFITLDNKQVNELAENIGVESTKVSQRIASLHELNPMLGHRGCRLGIAYPVITEMQASAIPDQFNLLKYSL